MSSLVFVGAVDAAEGASVSLSLEVAVVTFERTVDMGLDSSLVIAGAIGILSFPSGLLTSGTTSIRSSTPNSVAVAMETTWYAVDPSANTGSVTFGAVGHVLIGTADGTLPGAMHVELNGLQPGGGGVPQRAEVDVSTGGEITIPPAVSLAVGQVFTDDRIAESVATVNGGGAGLCGL